MLQDTLGLTRTGSPDETISALERQAARLELILEISRVLTSTLDTSQLLDIILNAARELTDTEAASIILLDQDSGDLIFAAATSQQDQLARIRVPLDGSIAGLIVRERRPLVVEDVKQEPHYFGEASQSIGFDTRSLLGVPLIFKEQVIGVLEALNKKHSAPFDEDDVRVLSIFADQAAVAIENARLFQAAVVKGRMERELQVASELQARLIPISAPQIAGWEFAARWQPAREVSGDYYDFIPVDQQLGLVVADVSDKGMAAALFMALTRSIVRASVLHAPSPAEGIAQANHLICADAANGMFVTLCYAQLDPQTGEVVYVNAGHNPPLLVRAERGEIVELPRSGMVLGFDAEFTFGQRAAQLSPGDFVLLYTDGLTEAISAHGEEFGRERLRRILLEYRDATAEEIAKALEQTLGDFVGETTPFDDVTLLIAKRL